MAQFQQRPEDEQNDWAGLPSEPLDPLSAAEQLDAPPPADHLLGFGAQYTSVVLPVAPPEPEASDVTADHDPDE